MNPVSFFAGVITAGFACLILSLTYNLAQDVTQADIKRKCEQFGVVDLPSKGSMFYCSRKPENK